MINRQKIVLFLVFIFLILLVSYLFVSITKKPIPGERIKPERVRMTITGVPGTKKIDISGISVNNFFLSPEMVNESGDVLINEEKDFHLVYLPVEKKFIISILSSPFEEKRQAAEKQFLATLAINQQQACLLDVSVTTPNFANPDFAGKSYHLSFCR